jgi:hypothetical protein
MSRVTAKNLLVRRIVQLLVTEGLSFCLFFDVRSRQGDPSGIRIGLGGPIVLLFFPLYAIEDREYIALLVTFLIDIAFALIITFSIIKKWRWIGGTCLLLFNLIGIMLVLNGLP